MKIVFLTDQVFLHGGVEKVLSQKANYFAERDNYNVWIITTNQQSNEQVYKFNEKIKFIDLAVNYEIGKSYFHPKNIIKIFKHRSSLSSVLKKIKPDIIVSCSFAPDFYFLPFVSKKVPKIKEFHGSRHFVGKPVTLKDKLLKKLSDFSEKKYDKILVLNDDEVQYYKTDNTIVIPNPVELQESFSDLNSKKIIAAGRISPVKNFEELIDIFSEIINDFPDWELHFYGEDYVGTQEKLQKKIDNLSISNNVKFMGTTDNIQKTLKNYSVYAMTSESECFPMILLESLSVGVPVVTYDCPTGPKFIVTNNEDSFLIPNKDKSAFIKMLKKIMMDEDLRKNMGEKAKNNVMRFQTKEVLKSWEQLFISLATDKK